MNSKELELLSDLVENHSLEDVLSSLVEVTLNKAHEFSDFNLKDQSKSMTVKAALIQNTLKKVSKL